MTLRAGPASSLARSRERDARREARPDRRAGFTMVEAILVILLIGLAAGVVTAFNPSTRETLALKSAGRQVHAYLRLCRDQAILQAAQNPCRYDPGTRSLTQRLSRERLELPEGVRLLPPVGLDSGNWDPDTPTERWTAARFYPDGSAEAGDLVLAAGSKRIRLAVDPIMGGATVQDTPAADAGAGEPRS